MYETYKNLSNLYAQVALRLLHKNELDLAIFYRNLSMNYRDKAEALILLEVL